MRAAILPPAIGRSYEARAEPSRLPELMDGPTSYETFRDTLKSLASVNRLSFGYRPLRLFLDRALGNREAGGPLRIVDIGSGYGDGVRAMATHLEKRGVSAVLTGVDINPFAARAASEAGTRAYRHARIEWVTADVFDYVKSAPPPDLVTSSLFCHHLESCDLPRFLSWMDGTARRGWLVNDLYRSRLASAGFGALATVLRRHPFVRHDGPVSFARSFRRADWQRFLGAAAVDGARLHTPAPFRLCVEKHAHG